MHSVTRVLHQTISEQERTTERRRQAEGSISRGTSLLYRVLIIATNPNGESCHAKIVPRAKIVPLFATKIIPGGTILVATSVLALPKVYQVVRKDR